MCDTYTNYQKIDITTPLPRNTINGSWLNNRLPLIISPNS